jgi:hypothetical protein
MVIQLPSSGPLTVITDICSSFNLISRSFGHSFSPATSCNVMNGRTQLARIGVAFQVVVLIDGRSRRMRLWVGMGPRLTGLNSGSSNVCCRVEWSPDHYRLVIRIIARLVQPEEQSRLVHNSIVVSSKHQNKSGDRSSWNVKSMQGPDRNGTAVDIDKTEQQQPRLVVRSVPAKRETVAFPRAKTGSLNDRLRNHLREPSTPATSRPSPETQNVGKSLCERFQDHVPRKKTLAERIQPRQEAETSSTSAPSSKSR